MYIHFSNLNRQTTDTDIYALLADYKSIGHCAICHIKYASTGQIKTFAIVDCNNHAEMERAISLLNGSILGGRKVYMQIGQ